MKPTFLSFLTICCISAVCACSKDNYDPYRIPSESSEISVKTSQFGGITQFSFEENDKLSLIFSTEGIDFKPYTLKEINKIAKDAPRDIVMINPAKSGRVLGFDGTKEVKNNLGMVAMTAGQDHSQTNLSNITDNLYYLVDYSDYVFTMDRNSSGFTIRHKASQHSFTDKGDKTDNATAAIWNSNAGVISFADASSVTGDQNLVSGSSYQLFVISDGLYLHSGRAYGNVSWYDQADVNTTWLVYPIPLKNFEYTYLSGKGDMFKGIKYDSAVDCYVLFPSEKKASLKGGKINVTIPESRNYVENGIARNTNIMLGKLDCSRGSVDMKNMMAVVSVPVTGTGRVVEIDITDKSGANIWGTATVDAQSYEFDSIEYGSATCILKSYLAGGVMLDSTKPQYFNTVMPAGALSKGYSIKVVTLDGSSVYEFQGVDVSRGEVVTLPVVNVL